jgi:hypothetical protein
VSLFDTALDGLHAACDATFGEPATFKPAAGGETACTVERFAPAPEFGLENAKASIEDMMIRTLIAPLPSRPKKGDIFTTGSGDLRVLATPTIEDDDGRRYTIKVERAP